MSESSTRQSRRAAVTGAGVVGALAAFMRVLPPDKTATGVPRPADRPPPERGGGYTLSEHVKRYYQTTRA